MIQMEMRNDYQHKHVCPRSILFKSHKTGHALMISNIVFKDTFYPSLWKPTLTDMQGASFLTQ